MTLKELYKEQQKELNKGLYFDKQKLNNINKQIYIIRQKRIEQINAKRRLEYEQKLTDRINARISNK